MLSSSQYQCKHGGTLGTCSEYVLSEDVLDLVVLGEDVLVLEHGLGHVPHLVQQRQRARRVTEGSPHRGEVHVVGEQQEQGCNIHCGSYVLQSEGSGHGLFDC